MRSDMDHTVLPANYTMHTFTPQPQSITALWLVRIYRPTEGKVFASPEVSPSRSHGLAIDAWRRMDGR